MKERNILRFFVCAGILRIMAERRDAGVESGSAMMGRVPIESRFQLMGNPPEKCFQNDFYGFIGSIFKSMRAIKFNSERQSLCK